MLEELRKQFSENFNLTASQIGEANGKGYRIGIHAPWPRKSNGVKYYLVQLCGQNPLTGEDIAKHDICAKFTFDNERAKTPVLTYHGQFILRCTAVLGDGTSLVFKEQEIFLDFPQNSPYVAYKVRNAGDFKLIEIDSNCWENCRGKIWLQFDGHDQRVSFSGSPSQTLRLLIPTSENISLTVQDELIRVRNGW